MAARSGFNSVARDLEQNHSEVSRILAAYDLECDLSAIGTDLESPELAAQEQAPRRTLRMVR